MKTEANYLPIFGLITNEVWICLFMNAIPISGISVMCIWLLFILFFFRSNGLFTVSKCSTYIIHGLIADQLLSIILMCPLFGSRVCTFPLLSLSCFNPVYSCEIHFKIWGSFTNLNDRKHSLSNIKCPPHPTPTTGGWTTNLYATSNTCMNANPSIGGILITSMLFV